MGQNDTASHRTNHHIDLFVLNLSANPALFLGRLGGWQNLKFFNAVRLRRMSAENALPAMPHVSPAVSLTCASVIVVSISSQFQSLQSEDRQRLKSAPHHQKTEAIPQKLRRSSGSARPLIAIRSNARSNNQEIRTATLTKSRAASGGDATTPSMPDNRHTFPPVAAPNPESNEYAHRRPSLFHRYWSRR